MTLIFKQSSKMRRQTSIKSLDSILLKKSKLSCRVLRAPGVIPKFT